VAALSPQISANAISLEDVLSPPETSIFLPLQFHLRMSYVRGILGIEAVKGS
jgi:hypothetical protein